MMSAKNWQAPGRKTADPPLDDPPKIAISLLGDVLFLGQRGGSFLKAENGKQGF